MSQWEAMRLEVEDAVLQKEQVSAPKYSASQALLVNCNNSTEARFES